MAFLDYAGLQRFWSQLKNYISTTAVVQQAATTAGAWLDANVTPVGSAVVVDSSLSISGAAADSAVTGQVKKEVSEVYDLYDKNNFYCEELALHDKDIVTASGAIVNNSGYKVSREIYMDFTKPIWAKNNYGNYVYCYGYNDAYYGRVNLETQNRYILNIYPNTTYIRVLAVIDADVRVMYWEYRSDESIYSPIDGWIKKSPYLKEALNNKVFRIATYNTGDFTGTGLTPNTLETAIEYRKAISELDADICAFQFDVGLMNDRQPTDYILHKFFADGYWNGNRNYDYFSIQSRYDLSNKSASNYSEGTALTHSYFQHCDLNIHGILVHIVNLHFEWRDNSQRASQIAQVIAHCANYDNCIVIGDFNPEDYINGVRQSTDLTYEEDLQEFIDVGFTPINANDDYFGVVNTIADGSGNGPWDNILIKGNMRFCSFGKLEKPYMNDHYPIYADIALGTIESVE